MVAKVYLCPEPPPDWADYRDQPDTSEFGLRVSAHLAAERAYVKRMCDLARANCKDPIAGEIVRWGRGDGYAEYIVWNVKPLQLLWLQTGDAWQVEAALLRGLTVTEVRAMVESDRRLNELFGRRKESA